MIVSRRSFLGLLAAASAARVIIPAFAPPREPYVRVGQSVSYVGLAVHPAPNFIGARRVMAIGEWDVVGYPVTLDSGGAGYDGTPDIRFYDLDLADLLTEVPQCFWHHKENWDRYPNVHAYVRERRYGEDPNVMRRRLGYSVVA